MTVILVCSECVNVTKSQKDFDKYRAKREAKDE